MVLQRQERTLLYKTCVLFALLGIVACSDTGSGPTPPPPPGNGIVLSGIPAPDSALQQLGIVIKVHIDTTSFGTCALQIDGAGVAGDLCFGTDFIIGGAVPTQGAHTARFTFAKYPSDPVTFDSSFTFTTVAPKIDRYSAVLLPPLPGDSLAGGSDMNESGVVVGQSVAPDGTSRPVRWIAGQPAALPHENANYGVASSINAAGAIAGLLGPPGSVTVIWTPTDSIITVTDSDPPVRINDAGQVLTQEWSRPTEPHEGFLIYDMTTGTSTQVEIPYPHEPRLTDFNNKGQAIGSDFGDFSDGLPVVWQYGGVSFPGVQVMYAPHGGSSDALDLTDSSEVLMATNGWVVFGTSASSVVLTPFFGTGSPQRANNNDVVVGVGRDSALYLWRRSANITERIDAGTGWTFSSVQKLNDNGAILARGQNSATGQSGSVVLTPIG